MSLSMIDQRARMPVLTFDAGMGKVTRGCSNPGKERALPLPRRVLSRWDRLLVGPVPGALCREFGEIQYRLGGNTSDAILSALLRSRCPPVAGWL